MGNRWPLPKRIQFAREAVRTKNIAGVAASAQVTPGTVARWVREHTDVDLADLVQAHSTVADSAVESAAAQAFAPEPDASYHDDMSDDLSKHQSEIETQGTALGQLCWNRWCSYEESNGVEFNDYVKQLAGMRTMWAAVREAGDENNNDSPYRRFMDTYIDRWADEATYGLIDDDIVEEEDMGEAPDGVDADVWRDHLSQQAKSHVSALIWSEVRFNI